MLHPRGRSAAMALSAACLFATSLIGGALGALMSLSSSPWYADYAAMGMTGIGLDPVDDQRLAGLIMWIPGGAVHGVAALALFYKWLKAVGGRPCASCPLRPSSALLAALLFVVALVGVIYEYAEQRAADADACRGRDRRRPPPRRSDVHPVWLRQLPRAQERPHRDRDGRPAARRHRAARDHRRAPRQQSAKYASTGSAIRSTSRRAPRCPTSTSARATRATSPRSSTPAAK